MKRYDPEIAPIGPQWLDVSEYTRIEMVAEYHRRKRVLLPNPRLHAVVHVIVENQLALDVFQVVEALKRLQGEGLSRHDAINAIGMVLTEHVFDAFNEKTAAVPDLEGTYLERLNELSADKWRRSGEE